MLAPSKRGAPGASATVPAARAMPTTTGFTASRWLGFGAIVTSMLTSRRRRRGRRRDTSRRPSIPGPRAARWPRTGSLNSARICAYGFSRMCASTFSRPRCAMPIIVWRAPAVGGAADDLVEDRHEHVEPFDREARLAGEGAVQESLEHFDLRDAIEQRFSARRIHRWQEASRLGRMAQPVALLGHEDMRVVESGGRAIDPAQLFDRLEALFDDVSATGPPTSEAGSCFRSSSVMPCARGDSDGSPGRRRPSGSSCAARCP